MDEAEGTGAPGEPQHAPDSNPAFVPLEVLAGRLAEVGGDISAPMAARARDLARIEGELLVSLPILAEMDPEFDGIRGHPTLADASRWRDEAEALGVPAGSAQRLVDQLTLDEVAAFATQLESVLGDADPALCFALLTRVAMLEQDALSRRASGVEVGGLRRRIRESFVRAVQASPPTEGTLDHWATQLLDRADVVLTSIDDVDPLPASRRLALVMDDLEWHLDAIDRDERWLRLRLRRKHARLRAEYQERRLQARLEERFGQKQVGRFERLIVALIFLVLAVLVAETVFDLPDRIRIPLLLADTVACLIFLWEFFVKLWMVEGSRLRWFGRHFLIDFLPSLPFGLVLIGNLQSVRAGRALRFLRIFRVARYLRWLLPALRMMRGFGFFARGLDRLVRRYGNLLNRNIILFPNRKERAEAQRELKAVMVEARRLRAAIGRQWRDLLQGASDEDRELVVVTRVDALDEARRAGHTRRRREDPRRQAALSDMPADAFIYQLAALNTQELHADMGDDFVARAARIVRLFARAPIRWFPIIRRYAPRVAPRMDDGDVVCAASHSIAQEMKRHHDRWFWCADLYGTVTPSEFVDRVGSAMVKGATRPAYRLVMFGGVFLIVQFLLAVIGTPRAPKPDVPPVAIERGVEDTVVDAAPEKTFLQHVHAFLARYVGVPLYVLGGICILVLGLGWWMKRIAGEATFFFDQTAKAQFLALTETFKGRNLTRDIRFLDRRVIGPEEDMQGVTRPGGAESRRIEVERTVREWLVEAQVRTTPGSFDLLERIILLYRDGLDGGLFCESDSRTTSQLIGNPALRQLRVLSDRVDRRERKALRTLDLDQGRLSLRGPYIWFSYISKAVAQAAARLIVEYNRHAIPLDELMYVTQEERESYERWLQPGAAVPSSVERPMPAREFDYVTTAFTALHFLDDDPGRDAEVEQRFGAEVLKNLQADRRLLFRTIFGTAPRHMRPKDRRVVNLYRVYESWFAGGRAFFIPVRLLWRGVVFLGRFIDWLVGAIGEIRRPKPRQDPAAADAADFPTAVRKIDRMRSPIAWACLWLRARFDAEYLGIELPGSDAPWPTALTVRNDMRFLGADPGQRRQVVAERDRAEWDVRRFAGLLEDGLFERVAVVLDQPVERLGAEHVRAAVAAYRADLSGVRTLLSCGEILRETRIEARRAPLQPRRFIPQVALRRAFKRWWSEHGRGDRDARIATWRAVARDTNESGAALRVWSEEGAAIARERGVQALADHLRHVGRITEQLVTLRTVQSLSMIDLLNYREHVFRVGAYAASGDSGGTVLALDPDEAAVSPSS